MTFYAYIFQSFVLGKSKSIYCCTDRMIVVIMYGLRVCCVLFVPGTIRTQRLLCVHLFTCTKAFEIYLLVISRHTCQVVKFPEDDRNELFRR